MKAWVRRWVKETMTRLGHAELGTEVIITWRRVFSKIGISEWCVHRNGDTGERLRVSGFKLSFSENLWPYIPTKERYETVVHECCHLVDAIENNNDDDPHGKNWINLMRSLGREGEATIDIKCLSAYREVILEQMNKCSLCGEPGHNSRTCTQRISPTGLALEKLLGF